MSAPERIWAWWEFDNDHRAINQWEDVMSSDPNAVYDHAAYIREDTVAEMIRQAVDDTTGLHLVIAAIREATVGGKPMLSDLPAALLEWRQAAVTAEREACAQAAEDWFYNPETDVVDDLRLASAIRARGEAWPVTVTACAARSRKCRPNCKSRKTRWGD